MPKTLPVPFSEFEAALIEALALREGVPGPLVVRRALVAFAQETLQREAWDAIAKANPSSTEWSAWIPPWRAEEGRKAVRFTQSGIQEIAERLALVESRLSEVKRESDALDARRAGNKAESGSEGDPKPR